MIHELAPESFARVEHIFRDRKQYTPALAVLQHRFPGSDKHYESTYTLDPDSYRQLPDALPIPGDLALQQTDFPIIPEAARRLDFIPDHLAQRTAFGFQLVRQEEPVAICKSNGLESGGEFMIDVRTISKSDQGKGLATLVTRALIDHALKTGLTPLWETTEDNLPSQRLARRFGFVKRETYPVYAIEFPDDAGPQSSID